MKRQRDDNEMSEWNYEEFGLNDDEQIQAYLRDALEQVKIIKKYVQFYPKKYTFPLIKDLNELSLILHKIQRFPTYNDVIEKLKFKL